MTKHTDLGIEHLDDVREIGRGGFSVVYAATNTLLGTRVAVKVLNPLSRESDRRRFERECQVMGRLSHHPSVVTVHHAGYATDGSPYLVMELVEGGSLADRLDRHGAMSWQEAVDHVVLIAEALAYVHDAGVLHRDVKPENILIGAQGQPLLTDFGIARLGESGTNTATSIAASWLHSPPETFDDRREPRSDLYSLASTLYQLIDGHPPFYRSGEESINPLMYRLVNEPPPRLRPELAPPALADVLERSLAKNPEHRPADLRRFTSELEAIRASGQAARPVAPAPSSWPPPAGFEPDAQTAAADAPAWFGPSSRTVVAEPPPVGRPPSVDPPLPSGSRSGLLVGVAGVMVAALTLVAGVVGYRSLVAAPASPPEDLVAAEESTTTDTTGTSEEPSETTVEPADPPAGRLAEVIDRGVLRCGVNGALPFFSLEEADGTFTGFDVDFCRVIAAAVLGDAAAVEFTPLTAAERFTALQSGTIDVLVRNTSQTASRSGEQQAEFPYTTFLDGQTFMVPASTGITSLADLDNASICVIAGTTTELRVRDTLQLGATAELLTFDDNTQLTEAYLDGRCEAWTSDATLLASLRSTFPRPDDHVILPDRISSEPLGPAVAAGDAEWAQAVRWAVMATVQAWEAGIDSTNVDTYTGSDPTSLIITGQTAFDPGLGLQPSYARLVVAQVGNYREIYEANFAGSGLDLDGSANDLVRNGGQLFAPPLR